MKLIWMRDDIEEEIKKQSKVHKLVKTPKKNKKKSIKKDLSLYKGKNGYREYLKTDWWIKRRAKYWKYHKRKCYCCGNYATELHHNNYSRLGCEKDKDLVALCHECHTKVHNIQKSTRKLKNNHKILKDKLKRKK